MTTHWYSFSDIWQRSPFLRMLNKSLSFRIAFTLVAAYLILVGLGLTNSLLNSECQTFDAFAQCIEKKSKEVISIGNAEALSIVVVALLFVLESPSRKRQEQYEAWQVIDNAAAANVPTSYARIQALQDLHQSGVSLKGLDVPKADLQEINLYGADLREADFRKADLRGANLSNASLTEANLCGANLTDCNLRNVSLYGAKLQGANLSDANLSYVNFRNSKINDQTLLHPEWIKVWVILNQPQRNRKLVKADLSYADLRWAELSEADLTNANLRYANLYGANLIGAILIGADVTGATLPQLSANQFIQIYGTSKVTDYSNVFRQHHLRSYTPQQIRLFNSKIRKHTQDNIFFPYLGND